MEIIYLDNASTTKPSQQVIQTILHSMENNFANPSSLHNMGLNVEKSIKEARLTFAKYLNATPEEIYFTSGGTESNNLAIQGVVNLKARTHNHIITVKTEHPSVLTTIKNFEQQGYKVDYLNVNKQGHICEEELLSLIKETTAIVSIMDTNNETGAIQNINNIGKLIKEKSPSTMFHVDAVQSFGKRALNLKYVDLISFSSHKINGVKGVGGLYIKKGTKLKPLFFGGSQQNSVRPGTENTFGILAFATAAKEAYENIEKRNNHVTLLKNRLLEVKNIIEDVHINSDINGSPYICNISFLGVKGEVLLHSLEKDNICVGTGSACSSRISHNVLSHMGYGKEVNTSSIRFSFSYENTINEIDTCINTLEKHVKFLRQFKKR